MKRILFFIIILCACIQPSFASDNSWSEGADINNDGIVDYKDFAIMAKYWLANDPNIPEITWVDINDPGVSGHEGFVGQMSRYETTNDQYCFFLNAALASGDITIDENGIVHGANGSNSGEDFVDEPYFYTYEASSYSQIIYTGEVFTVRSRDGYYMGNHPVVVVSWYGATAFCNYYSWRLPTEWQWQAVADYNGSYTYGCGTTISFAKANYKYITYANPLNLSSYPYTSPVNHYPSYGYGMNDMAGNVWEWTSSYDSPCCRFIRGGSWSYSANDCKVSYWYDYSPITTSSNIGFRVCR